MQKILIITLAVCLLSAGAASAAKTPALSGSSCIIPEGTIGATVTGVGVNPDTKQTTEIRTQARIDNPSGNTIFWNFGGAANPADPVSGTSGPGKLSQISGSSDYELNATYPIEDRTINVKGIIKSGGNVCSGNGTWTATRNKVSVGNGTWTIP